MLIFSLIQKLFGMCMQKFKSKVINIHKCNFFLGHRPPAWDASRTFAD